jgi:ribosomal protein S18 acetylase RimI-like enzyme
MDIRSITESEWPLARKVRLAALPDAPAAFGTTLADALERPDDMWQERARACETGGEFSAIAMVNGEPVGMVGAFPCKQTSHIAYLVGMWVAPEYRGTGVAEALVDAVLAWAPSQGMTDVFLGVKAGNDRAVGLYRKCGFVVCREPPSDSPAVSGCEIVMGRELGG